MTEAIIDAMGNEIIQPGAIKTKSKTKSKDKSEGHKSDYQLAKELVEAWKMPLAYHGGELWSFHVDTGWTVVSKDILSVANKLRGQNAEKTVYAIICNQLSTPDMANVADISTYWERIGGVWGGTWRPLKLGLNQVAFSNGILSLGAEMDFEPTEKRIIFGPRITIPFDLDEGLDLVNPEFGAMLEYALPDKAEREYLQDLCGLILQPHKLLRGQIVFWGMKHSGKSTLATAIACAPAGMVGASFMSEAKIVSDKWATIPLVNKFLNVSNDSAQTRKWEAWMKEYTTGMVTVEPKFCRPTSLPVTAKLITTCNEFQETTDPSGAAEQRYRVFQFTRAIEESGRSEQTQYMSPSYWCSLERRSGIVAWMLRGLLRVIDRGLIEPESLKAKKIHAIGEANPVYYWIRNNISKKVGAFTTAEDIQGALASEGINPPHSRVIAGIITRVWGVSPSRSGNKRGYAGLSL